MRANRFDLRHRPVWTHLLLFLLLFPVHRNVNAQPITTTELQTNNYGYLANFNSSMAMVLVFLVCAFFLMGFFSIYIRRCAESHISAGASLAPAGAGSPSRRRRGLDPAVIDSFPVFVYSAVKDLKIGKGALECAVCLGEFDDCETLRLLPKCDHVFHPDCIDEWLASHVTCPVCRAKLAPPAESDAPATESNLQESSSTNTELNSPQNDVVVVHVNASESRDPPQAVEIVNRPAKSRIFSGKFPRSHSTGHSLVQPKPGLNTERYTLRLPEEVRRQLVLGSSGNCKLRRTTSFGVVLPRLGSSRKGYRWYEEVGKSSGRFDPWVLTLTPPFFARAGSVKSSSKGGDGDGMVGRPLLTSVRMPLECLNVKEERCQESKSRLPV